MEKAKFDCRTNDKYVNKEPKQNQTILAAIAMLLTGKSKPRSEK